MANCIDIIRPLEKHVGRLADFQLIGGVGSAALSNLETTIDVGNKEIIAPHDLYLSQRRSDSAKSLRDLDVLVLSDDKTVIKELRETIEGIIGERLEPSVFGLKSTEALAKQMRNPLGLAAIKTFVSDRYVLPDGMVKSLLPFSVSINPESLETWTLVAGGVRLPVPNPAMSIINYTNRSITGVRPKDMDKISKMSDVIFSKAPELRPWALDGPGSEQFELGLLLQALTPNKQHPDYFKSGRPIPAFDTLAENKAFMFPDLNQRQKNHILIEAVIKARILSLAESNPELVSYFQKFLERISIVKSIVNND